MKGILEFYGFSEPMMFAHVSLMHYVDHHLKSNQIIILNVKILLKRMAYQDIHEKSFFA